jgi:hypothetical protein
MKMVTGNLVLLVANAIVWAVAALGVAVGGRRIMMGMGV